MHPHKATIHTIESVAAKKVLIYWSQDKVDIYNQVAKKCEAVVKGILRSKRSDI